MYYEKEYDFNQWLKSNSELSLLAPRDLSGLRTNVKSSAGNTSWENIVKTECNSVLKTAKDMQGFLSFDELIFGGDYTLFTNNMRAFSETYLQIISFRRSDLTWPNIAAYFNTEGATQNLESQVYSFKLTYFPNSPLSSCLH